MDPRHWNLSKEWILFFAGLLLLVYEAVLYPGPPRGELILIYAGMMGVPFVRKADAQMKKKGDDE